MALFSNADPVRPPVLGEGMLAGASTSIDGSSPVVYAAENNDTYKWFKAPFEPVYTVTAGEAENGSVTVKPVEAKEGEVVTVTAEPDEGYELDELCYMTEGGDPVAVENGEFTMPAADVTVTATFKKLLFTVAFVDEDGTELQRGTVPYGEMPVFEGADPVKDADDGYTYTFKGWEPELTEASEDAVYKAVYTAEPVEEPEPQQVEAPVLPKEGTFSGSKTITITCGTEGAVIYYTTDGSDPALTTAAALEYSGGFKIDKTTTVTAIAVKDSWLDSEVVRAVYTLKEKSTGGGGGSSAPAKTEEPFVNPFKDVRQGDWFYDAVMWAVKNGVTDGTTPTTFSPSGTATRAQTVTFLWRAAGCPEPEIGECPFGDIPAGAYYRKAVLWAYENGITDGTSETTFSPDDVVTRAQTVTFLYRYMKLKGEGFEGLWSFELEFSDVDEIPEYALEAFSYGVMKGVIEGDGGRLLPNGRCTRAQIVTMLSRYFAK